MTARRKKTTSDPTRIRAVSGFLSAGFRDYLGARVLLNHQLPLQGAILASTSVEQYFKAILAFHGNPRRGHLSPALIRAVENCDRKLVSVLNRGFLSLLQKCYRLRYHDDIDVGCNIVVSTRELLAEIDFTVGQIESRITISRRGTSPSLRHYGQLSQEHDKRLLLNNYVLADIRKEQFLDGSDFAYEMRLDPVRGSMEAEILIKKAPTDGDFMREGFSPVGSEESTTYQLSLAADGNLLTPDGSETAPPPKS